MAKEFWKVELYASLKAVEMVKTHPDLAGIKLLKKKGLPYVMAFCQICNGKIRGGCAGCMRYRRKVRAFLRSPDRQELTQDLREKKPEAVAKLKEMISNWPDFAELGVAN